MTTDEIKAELKKRLKPQRYAHCLGVADTAKELAKIYGADEDAAYLAGILHDCAKNYTTDELYQKAEVYITTALSIFSLAVLRIRSTAP